MTVETGNLSDRKEMFRSMLTDAVAVLCRNTMPYNAELSIEGLIGITADKKDIVLVSINEIIGQGSQKSTIDCDPGSPHKSKSRKRKKIRMSQPEPEKENKAAKVDESANLVSELPKDLDFDMDSFVKKELPDISQVTTPYGGYRNELYNTNDDQLPKTTAPSFPTIDPLQQFSDTTASISTDFPGLNLNSEAAALLSQPHSDLLLERLDENGSIVYQCTICQKIIKSKGNFGRHLKGHVNSAVIHTCEICSKTFGRKDNLRRHLTMVHQVEVPNKGNANPANDDGDNVGDILPTFSDSLSGALEAAQETANNSEHVNKAMFPQEENHASKYFQQHTISSLGLDNSSSKPESEEQQQQNDLPNNSVANMTPVNLPQDTNNSLQGFFSPPPTTEPGS